MPRPVCHPVESLLMSYVHEILGRLARESDLPPPGPLVVAAEDRTAELYISLVVKPHGNGRPDRRPQDRRSHPPRQEQVSADTRSKPLSPMERNILEAVAEGGPLRGPQVAEKAGYPEGSHFRKTMSKLRREGYLGRTLEGYVRTEKQP